MREAHAPLEPRLTALRVALDEYERSASTAERQAAVTIVLRERVDGIETLLIRRAEHPDDPWSGHMAFPGGRVDPTDASPLAAAVRETREELALDLEAAAELIGRLSTVPVIARGRRLPMVIEPFVFALEGEPVLEPNYEVAAVNWIPLAFFAAAENRRSFRWQRDGLSRDLPCYDWPGGRVWGLTLRMVDDLLIAAGMRGEPSDWTGVER